MPIRVHSIRIPSLLILLMAGNLPRPVPGETTPAPEATKPPDAAAKPEAPKLPTHTVQKQVFKVEVTVDGVFESKKMTPVSFWPEAWEDLLILEAVEHGAEVKKGDTLLRLDTRKIDEAIEDLEAQAPLAEFTHKVTQEELSSLEKSVPLDLEQAGRSYKIAEEDLKIFEGVDRPWAEKWVNQRVKWINQWLEYDLEELRQLEKMYKADDLTEETEEIILKRQKNEVERTKFFLESAKVDRDQELQIYLPRREQDLRLNSRQQSLAWERVESLLPLNLSRKRLEIKKQKYDRERAEERLQKLKKDRAAMSLQSPAEGLAFYGPCVRGRWQQIPAYTAKLQPGGRIVAREVFITVVEAQPLFVRVDFQEDHLHHLRAGLDGKASPTGHPKIQISAEIESISAVPVESGKFEAKVSVRAGQHASKLMPGMNCKAKFTPYLKKDALVVPSAAVFPDEIDDEKFFVFVLKEGGEHEKRVVEIGEKYQDKTEILSGLKEGDVIFLQNPEKQPPPAPKPGENKK